MLHDDPGCGSPACPSAEGADRDLLHAVRRADWRFLLPDPQLDDVAYVAPHDPELAAALRRVAGMSRCSTPTTPAGEHDVVVATGAGRVGAAAGLAACPPGRLGLRRDHGPRERPLGAALRREGLEEVDVVWLWPTAAAPKEMVPLHDAAAVRHALGRRDPGARLRVRAWAARALLAARALPLVVPAAAVARPAGPGRPREHRRRPARRALRRARPRRLRRRAAARLRPADPALRHVTPRRRARPGRGRPGARRSSPSCRAWPATAPR